MRTGSLSAEVTLLIALLGFPASGLAKDAPSSAAALDGHRLFRAGEFEKAATKLETAVRAGSDPELRFELAVCYERLDRDSEATAEFRAYRVSPVALRVREADQHIAAIESKQPAASLVPKPRRVVVPSESGKCARDCGTSPSLFCGNASNRMRKACAVRFSCLRSCPGAKVQPGSCLTKPNGSTQVCVTDP